MSLLMVSVQSVQFSCRCVGNNIMLLTKAFRKKFIIPEFEEFAQQINKMFDNAQKLEDGKVSGALAHFFDSFFASSL